MLESFIDYFWNYVGWYNKWILFYESEEGLTK